MIWIEVRCDKCGTVGSTSRWAERTSAASTGRTRSIAGMNDLEINDGPVNGMISDLRDEMEEAS